jgi:hypothetical protein
MFFNTAFVTGKHGFYWNEAGSAVSTSQDLAFIGCRFEGTNDASGWDVYININTPTNKLQNVIFINCRFGNVRNNVFLSGVETATFIGCTFAAGSGKTALSFAGQAAGTLQLHNCFFTTGGAFTVTNMRRLNGIDPYAGSTNGFVNGSYIYYVRPTPSGGTYVYNGIIPERVGDQRVWRIPMLVDSGTTTMVLPGDTIASLERSVIVEVSADSGYARWTIPKAGAVAVLNAATGIFADTPTSAKIYLTAGTYPNLIGNTLAAPVNIAVTVTI